MACMGPDDDAARRRAREAFAEIKLLLQTKYGISKEFYIGSIPADAEREYKKLQDAVEEIFVLDCYDNW